VEPMVEVPASLDRGEWVRRWDLMQECYRGPRREYRCKLDGHQEAHLLALAQSTPPEGHWRWSLRLLADRMVELEYVDTLSYQTVRSVLKRGRCSLGAACGG
jgi:hypothetical protein